jgi:hypothetical protein
MIPKSGNRFSDKIMRRTNVMRRMPRVVLLAGLVALMPVLSGCESFDPDKLDVFGLNEKKKLPGERKAMFPQGVPGVQQGIPPEYIKGNQPAADATQTPVAAAPADNTAAAEPEETPKPKPTAKRAAKPSTTQPAQQPPSQEQQPAPQQAQAPWPSSPPPAR